MASTAIRWSGLILIAGALVLGAAIVVVTLSPSPNQAFSPLVGYLFWLAGILLLLALPGMYARQANPAGWLGLAGFVLLQAGTVLFVMLATPVLWYPSTKEPFPESISAFLLGIALTLGLLLTGVATLRAGVYSRWASILLLGATLLFFFSFFIAEFLPPVPWLGALLGILLASALAWIGASLLRGGISRDTAASRIPG